VEGISRAFDEHVGGLWSFIAEAFCSYLNNGVELDDVDAAVLFDYIDCTGRHVSNVVRAIRPAFTSPDPEERSSALVDLCDRDENLPPFLCDCSTNLEHIAELASGAITLGEDSIAAARRLGMSEAIVQELDFALAHLDTILYIADPAYFEPWPGSNAKMREYLAEAREDCRRDVEESRSLVRAQLLAASN
jgi:hypothetical protein